MPFCSFFPSLSSYNIIIINVIYLSIWCGCIFLSNLLTQTSLHCLYFLSFFFGFYLFSCISTLLPPQGNYQHHTFLFHFFLFYFLCCFHLYAIKIGYASIPFTIASSLRLILENSLLSLSLTLSFILLLWVSLQFALKLMLTFYKSID
jgi:hypothetical protein